MNVIALSPLDLILAASLLLGGLLLFFPQPLVQALGVPASDNIFYPSILGAVLLGIGVALLIECRRVRVGFVGLGLGGGHVFRRTATQTNAVEVLGAWQFVDDEAFIDDNQPAAGDYFQVRAGVKTSFAPRSRRHLVFRAGGTTFDRLGRRSQAIKRHRFEIQKTRLAIDNQTDETEVDQLRSFLS